MTEEERTKLALEDRRALLDALFALAKWVIATLFLLNGAAALAVLSHSEINPVVNATIALLYVNGVLASLVAGIALVASLLGGYAHILNRIGRSVPPAILSVFLVVQLACASVSLLGIGVGVKYFIDGTTMWGNATIAMAKQHPQLPAPCEDSAKIGK